MSNHLEFIEKEKTFLEELRVKIGNSGNMNFYEQSVAIFRIDIKLNRIKAYLKRLRNSENKE